MVPVDPRVQDLVLLPPAVQVSPIVVPSVRLVAEVLDVVEAVHSQLAPALPVGLRSANGREDQSVGTEVFGGCEEVAPSVNERGIDVGISHRPAAHGAHGPAVFHHPRTQR